MKWLLILLMLAPSWGFTQAKTPKKAQIAKKKAPAAAVRAEKWPVATLKVEGSESYSADRVLAVAGLKIGQMAGKEEFDAARDRLLATGAFETVGYRFEPGPDGKVYVATFQVTEAGPLLPVRFDSLGVPAGELENLLRSKDPLFSTKLPATAPVMSRCTTWIREYLRSKGLDDDILGGVAPWPDDLAIVFRSAKALPIVAEVTFEGEKALTEDALRQAVAGAAIGAPYTETRFREILDASVRPAYEAKGYVRVAYPKIRTEPAEDVKGLRVFVTVSEGESYKLGKVAIAGPAPLKPEDLLRTAALKAGDTADFDRVKEGLDNIRKAVKRAGYLDVQVSSGREIHDEQKAVDIAFQIDAGPRYAMGNLTIAGLDLTAEAEMKRIWTMSRGKPFDPEYPDYFLKQVRDMFDNLGETKSAVQVNASDHTADVTLTFEGAKKEKQPPRKVGL